jgi:hypothetical protein
MNYKLLGILTALLLTTGFSDSFAVQITIQTDGTFAPGEKIELSGTVAGASEGDLAAIEIKDDSGETILIRTVELGSNGSFYLKFKIPSSSESSSYDIIVNAKVNGEPVTELKKVSSQTSVSEPEAAPAMTSAPEQTQQSKGGGCLIATAAFGSEMSPQVQLLREIRDNTVLQTESGSAFMTGFNQFYYSFSPAIADYERENPVFKEAVKLTLTPLLTSLTLLQYADIDSESEMLGYGIGIILLNIGMYFVAPAVLIMAVRKRI